MKTTSWDANVFLCLIGWGLPEDVVKGMLKVVKKVHEEFSLGEDIVYWISNSPTLVQVSHPTLGKMMKFYVPNDNDRGSSRTNNFRLRLANTIEFKREWRLRSIEERKKKVIDWNKFGNEQEKLRHQIRLKIINHSSLYNNNYTKNLWETWGACASREYVSEWYEGIHPGRFFLFYKKNKIIEERNRRFKKGPCEDRYQYPKIPIYDWGPYEQLIEDLRCIDGPGLGETGSKVEHIDDLFI
jgi:hypothetical protein